TGRLSDDHGFSFHPGTVSAGLAGCEASADLAAPSGDSNLSWRAWACRVWLAQLGQWRGVTGDLASCLSEEFATPRALYEACQHEVQKEGLSKGNLDRD
ncbi:unnamed protein product, partial [Protopolystoma xenopodis]